MGVEQVLAVSHGILQQRKVALPKHAHESCARSGSRASQICEDQRCWVLWLREHRVSRSVARPSPRAEERHRALFGGPDRPPHELVQQRGGWLVSVSDWPFKAAEAAVPLSNWLRTLQLPQLTRDCSQMCNKIQFGLVLCKDVPTLDFLLTMIFVLYTQS